MVNNTIKLNRFLNTINKDIKKGNNIQQCIRKLEELLHQPYCKTRIKDLLFRSYMILGKVSEAYSIIKELYETTNNEDALFDLVKLLLDIGDVTTAKKYVDNADYSNMKIYLLGLINKYEGEFDYAKKYFERLNHTLMEESMHIELANIYEHLGKIEKEKEELYYLLNTKKKYQAKIRLIKIAMGENDPNLPVLFDEFDVDNCWHQGDLVQFKRCLKFYKYKLGTLTKDDLDNYSSYQLYKYSRKSAIKHINKRHLVGGNLYKLNADINLEEVYNYCKNNLNHLIRREENDIFLVKMPYEIGNLMGNDTDLLEVVTISNTDKILTFYPVAKVGMYTKILNGEIKYER